MNLRVSSGPHLLGKETTSKLMLYVLIALLPTTYAGVYLFGLSAAAVLLASVTSAVLSELVWQKLMKQPVRINDLSAAVTGLILGLNLPPHTPLWIPVLGSMVAILLVKQLFGGIGHNFMNPAMFARAILLASWPVHMTMFSNPVSRIGGGAVDTMASATPLKSAASIPYIDLLLGNISGTIGEVCKIAILIGFVFLLLTKVIKWHIPVLFVGTVALLSFLMGSDPLYTILTGGVLFGAVFMATDYVTNPMFTVGQCIFAVMCGVIVVVIRKFGNYPEGVTYAILFMNALTPLIDRYTRIRIYGEVKKGVKK